MSLWTAGVALLIALAALSAARADDEDVDAVAEAAEQRDADAADDFEEPKPKPAPSKARKGEIDDQTSLMFRAGIIEGQGIAQSQSLVPVEIFPYILTDDSLFFSDLRFYSSYDLTLGGNAGLGYRYYSRGLDRIFGISGWYDADHVREDNFFQQAGLSLESYGKIVDFRTNLYLPVGETYQELALTLVPNSTEFSGENVVFDQVRRFYAAMKGIDMEAGVLLPGDFADEHGIRVFGGFYHFEDDKDSSITGASARVQANIVAGLDAGVQVTNDSFYDTRAFLNVAWTFGPLHRSQMSQKTVRGRLGEHVTRNHTVVAPIRSQLEQDRVAVDPGTGQPYRIAHVNSAAAPGGSGGVDDPYQTIAAAQLSAKDIVFVHAGSVFSGADSTIVLGANERILGDGVGISHFIQVRESGRFLLPHGPTSGSAPLLDASTGDAVTLASNSEFSGFGIANSSGHGIVGTSIHDVLLRGVSVLSAGGDGIRLLNSSGEISISDAIIAGASGNGLVIDGGAANVQFAGTLSANSGHDLMVANTSGGLVDLTEADFMGSGSQGILLNNVAGDVNFDEVSLDNPTGTGIAINGVSGNVDFAGRTSVSGAGGTSIQIKDLAVAGNVTFEEVAVNNRHGAGIVLDNSDGTVLVTETTTIANELGSTASAIDVQNSAGTANFAEAEVTDATGAPGVNVKNNTGTNTFTSLDVGSTNGTALFALNGGTLVINANGIDPDGGAIHAVNGTAIDIENTTVNAHVTSASSSGASVGLRLISVPGTFAVLGDENRTDGSGGTIEGASAGILLQNVGTVGLASMILDGNGVGIVSNDVERFAFTNFRITDSTTYGLDASNTRTLIVSNSVFANNGLANVHADFNSVASNAYTFFSNLMVSTTADNIQIESLAGAAGSIMNLSLESNSLANSRSGDAALDVDWDGNLTATMVTNSVNVSGGSNTGFDISNTSISAPTAITIDANEFTSSGGTDTAFKVSAAGSSQVTVSRNTVNFNATNGTGMKFALGSPTTVNIHTNRIQDMTDGGAGIVFDSLVGPGSVTISNNIIQLADTGGLLDRGITFSSVTNPIIGGVTFKPSLASAHNNIITGADTIFSVPANTTTGNLLINGTLFP